MKFELITEKNVTKIKLSPINDQDVFDLGVLSTKISYELRTEGETGTPLNIDYMIIDINDLIKLALKGK